jgi:hypothetical protein
MITIKATVRGRRLEIQVPADWPDGTEVEIQPLEHAGNSNPDVMSAEEIARTLAAMDQIQPFDMTEAEHAAWQAECRTRRDREKADFVKHADELGSMWE